jgi:hypothetical protein
MTFETKQRKKKLLYYFLYCQIGKKLILIVDLILFVQNYYLSDREWKNANEDEIFNRSNPGKNKFKPKPKWLAKWKDMKVEDLKGFIAI